MHLRILLACLLISTGAFAQSGKPILQTGNVTPGHLPYWVTSGVQGDGGSASDSPITSIGVTGPICSNSARQASGAYNAFCIYANTNSPAVISLQNYGSAPAESIQFNINGALQGFPTVSPLPVTVGDFPAFSTTGGGLTDSGIPSSGLILCPVLGTFSVGTGSAAECSNTFGATAVLNGNLTLTNAASPSFTAPDGAGLALDFYTHGGAAVYPILNFFNAGGTTASPTQTLANSELGGYYGLGWGTGTSPGYIQGGGFEMVSTDNFQRGTTNAAGSQFWWYLAPPGMAANSIVMQLTGSGVLTLGVNSSLGTITGGSGYTNGTYTNVPLTTVSGTVPSTVARATIVVSGGAVATVTITQSGNGYGITSVLSASNTNLGGSGSGFSVPISSLGPTGAGGAITSGYSGSIVLNSAFGGAIDIVNNNTQASYTMFLPQTVGASGNCLLSGGAGNYQTWGNCPTTSSTGSWTPTLIGSTTAGTGQTYNQQYGTYESTISNGVKVTTARFNIYVSGIGTAAGNALIGGLPFSSVVSGLDYQACPISFVSGLTYASGATTLGTLINPGSSNITLWEFGSGTTVQPAVANLVNTQIVGFCVYRSN